MRSILIRSGSAALVAGETLEVDVGDVGAGELAERPPAESRALMQFEAWLREVRRSSGRQY